MSNQAKITVAAIAVAVVAWLWLASGGKEPPPGSHTKPAREAARSGAGRVPGRLPPLRRQRLAEKGEHQRGRRMRTRDLPTPAALGNSVASAARRDLFRESAPGDESDIDPDDFETLSDTALHDDDPDNRIVAAWLLGSLENEPVIPVLAKVLNDPDPEVRLAAVESLSDLEDLEENPPLDLLEVALDDDDPEVRFEALSIVTELEGPEIEPLVAKALDDPDEDVRSLAESAADFEDSTAEEAAIPQRGPRR